MFTRVLVLCLISVSNLSFAQAKQAVSSQSAVYCILLAVTLFTAIIT